MDILEYGQSKKIKKIDKKIKIGEYPTISENELRLKVADLKRELIDNGNLSYKVKREYSSNCKKDEIAITNLQKAYDKFKSLLTENIKNKEKAKPFELHILRPLKNRVLKSICKEDIKQCYNKLKKEGKYETIKKTHSVLLELCRIWIENDYEIDKEILSMDMTYYRRVGKVKGMRGITDIKRFMELLQVIDKDEKLEPVTKLAMQLSPYIFLRSGTMRQLEWSFLDVENKVLRIPGRCMKAGEDFEVPLSKSMLDIFDEVRKYTNNSKYIFTS